MAPRLLLLSQTLPFPPDSGVKIRAFHTLRILSGRFDIRALSFYRREQTAEDGVDAALAALSEFAEIEAFPVPQEWSRGRWVWDHLRSVPSGRPYTEYVFESRDFRERLERVRREGAFDLVHLESSVLAPLLPRLPEVPRVCVHHNVESELLARRAEVAKNPLTAAYLRLQSRLVRRSERRTCPHMDCNVTVSERDEATLRSIAPEADFTTLPNGVDTDAFQPSDGPTDGIVLLGGTDWFPNLDGLQFFADEVLPRIRRERPDVPVTSVGRASGSEIERFRRQGIELTGYVDDIRTYVHRARCLVVPLRVGGGSRLKILDAWAMGKAVVTTAVGCEGLAARDGENALVRDDAEGLANAVLRLLADEELAERLGGEARREAVASYSWEAIAEPMLKTYDRLLEEAE